MAFFYIGQLYLIWNKYFSKYIEIFKDKKEMFIYMPLMKVRREDDTGWYTVDHLNFNYIGLGIN